MVPVPRQQAAKHGPAWGGQSPITDVLSPFRPCECFLSSQNRHAGLRSTSGRTWWAFGCVFFEMVTATRAFEGANVAEVLASVLAREPDWSRIHSALTPVIAVYLKRCLQKDPKQRIHDIADVRLALDGAFDLPTPDRSPLSAPSPARATWLMTTLLLASVVGAGAAYLATQTSDSSMPRISCLEVTTSGASTLTLIDNQRHIAITPDGARLVYVGNRGTAVIRPPARLFGSDSSVHALPSRPVHLAR